MVIIRAGAWEEDRHHADADTDADADAGCTVQAWRLSKTGFLAIVC